MDTGSRTPDLGWRRQGTPASLPPPCPTHIIAKKRNLTRDWPSPARVRQGNEALLGQRTEQTPGLQHVARVQGKERGGGGPAATQGRGFPSECVHAAFGGPGALSPSAPSPDRAFAVPGGGSTGTVRSALRPATLAALRPSRCSLQGTTPWVRVASSFPFGDGRRGAGPPKSPSPPRGTADGKLRRGWESILGGPSLLGEGKGSQCPAYKKN